MNKPLPPLAESPQVLPTRLRTETDPKKRSRLQALYLLASGQAPSRLALAKLLAVPRHTVQTWLKPYAEGGLSALLTLRKAPGRQPSLTPPILTQLQTRLNHPRGFGSYGEIQQYLARVHKIRLAYSTVHKLVRYRLRAKPKAPRRSHPKKSPKTSPSSRPRLPLSSKPREPAPSSRAIRNGACGHKTKVAVAWYPSCAAASPLVGSSPPSLRRIASRVSIYRGRAPP